MPYLDLQGVKLFYELKGSGNPPVVFVHGFTCNHEDWTHQAEYFSSKQLVVTCDLRGHGLSDPDPQNCDMESYASDVISLIEHLELPPVVLAGHSMGCRVVLQAFADAPQHIAGLVLIEGSRAGGTGKPENVDMLISERIREHGYANMISSFFEGMFFEESDHMLKEKLVNRALTLPEETGSRLIRQIIQWDDNRLDSVLSDVTVPLLVLQSTYITPEQVRIKLKQDDTIPWLELIRRCVPSAQIRIIGGVGHFSMLEAPEKVNLFMDDFMSRLAN